MKIENWEKEYSFKSGQQDIHLKWATERSLREHKYRNAKSMCVFDWPYLYTGIIKCRDD